MEPRIKIEETGKSLSPIQVIYLNRIAGKSSGISLADQAAQFRAHALSGKKFLIGFVKMGEGQKMPVSFVMFSETKKILQVHRVLSAKEFQATDVKLQLLKRAADIARDSNKQLIGLNKGVSTASLIAAAKRMAAAEARKKQTPKKSAKKTFRRI